MLLRFIAFNRKEVSTKKKIKNNRPGWIPGLLFFTLWQTIRFLIYR